MATTRFFGPSSLLARTTATLAVSALAIVLIAYVALDYFVIQPITARSADDEAALVVLSAQTWVELPPDARPYFELELAQSHDLIITAGPLDLEPGEVDSAYFELVREKLSERLGAPTQLRVGTDLVWAEVPMGGYRIQVGFESNRRDIEPLYVGIVIVVLGAAVVFFTSLAIVRRIARPLVQVAERAESFRGAENFDPLPEQGPRELVSLARSFNTMAREVASLLSNRTTLLAGISHDLRTPLARMRLALALLPEGVDPSLIERFERNLEAMDELIGDTLRFARGAGEASEPVAIGAFVKDIVSGLDEYIPIRCGVPEGLKVDLAPGAFKRVMHNLIDNAQLHADAVRVHVDRVASDTNGTDTVVVHVLDSGPGIPEGFREQIFQPFFRLDASRSRTTGGSGLGLAIVHQLCQAHGWRICAGENDDGGADLAVTIPLAGVRAVNGEAPPGSVGT